MAATIKDVARLAGVSPSTVSRVLNQKGVISDETKQKISDLNNWSGDFSYLSQGDGYIYYKVDGTKLEMYGLLPDEQTAPTDNTWIPYTDSKGAVARYMPCASNTDSPKFTQAEIDRLYDRDPNTRQYWPIFQSVVDNSQGQIRNDYGY